MKIIERIRRLGQQDQSSSDVPAYLRAGLAVERQMTIAEYVWLGQEARMIGADRRIVEIGSYRGGSTVALGLGAKNGSGAQVFAVDPHQSFVGIKGGVYGPDDMNALYGNIIKLDLGTTIFVVALSSIAAAKAWENADIGLLWIDGDHRLEAVRADLCAWLPHLANDAIVAFHDAHDEGVRLAISEVVNNGLLHEVGHVDSIRHFRRGINH